MIPCNKFNNKVKDIECWKYICQNVLSVFVCTNGKKKKDIIYWL